MAQSITIDKILATTIALVTAGGGWMVSHYIKKIDLLERRIDALEAYRSGHDEAEKWQQSLLKQLIDGRGQPHQHSPLPSGQSLVKPKASPQ